jgi:hypothetical protein
MAEDLGSVPGPTGTQHDVSWEPKTGEVWVKIYSTFSSSWEKCDRRAASAKTAMDIAESYVQSR